MNTDYDFYLRVQLPNGKMASTGFRVPACSRVYEVFNPMDVCSDPMTAFVVGGKTLEMSERIKTEREALARDISNRMTEGILRVLEEQDTQNGYPKGQ